VYYPSLHYHHHHHCWGCPFYHHSWW
jgi:hypothetical protein